MASSLVAQMELTPPLASKMKIMAKNSAEMLTDLALPVAGSASVFMKAKIVLNILTHMNAMN